eukprot:gene35873-48241_t
MNRLTFSAASWLSKSNKKRQWNIISSSIASAASKEDKKEEKKGGGGGDKKKKSEVGGGGGGDASMKARTESLEKFIQTAEKAKRLKIDFSPEELARHYEIGKEYNRQKMKRENAWNKEFTTMIYLQNDALAAMPAHLKEQALIYDETPAPDDRDLPIYETPPIKGFNPNLYDQNTTGKKGKKRGGDSDEAGEGDGDDDDNEEDDDDDED